MKGRIPIFETPEDLFQYYIGYYYREIEKYPSVRLDETEHIKVIEEVEKRYHEALKKRVACDLETWNQRYRECVNFLTKVYTKKADREAKQNRAKDFLNKHKK